MNRRDVYKYENLNKCCVYLDVYGSASNVYLDVVKMLFVDDEMVSVFPFAVFLTLITRKEQSMLLMEMRVFLSILKKMANEFGLRIFFCRFL